VTLHDLIAVVRARWYVVLAVLVLAAGAGVLFARDGGLYTTRTVVAFVVPNDGPWDGGGSREDGVIALALAVAEQAGEGRGSVDYAAADAPFFGAGIRQGVSIGLPDTGGQWEASYARAAINIDVVSPDRAWVVEQQQSLIAAVQDATVAYQSGLGSAGRVRAEVEQLTMTIEHVQPSRTSQLLAIAALAGAGLILGCGAAVMWDRRLSARRSGNRRALLRPAAGGGGA
jgi:hypothetical protein